MKPKFTFVLTLSAIAAATLLAIPGCKKSNSNPSSTTSSTSATINGTATQFTYTKGFEVKGDEIGVAGYNLAGADTIFFSITVPDSARVNAPYGIHGDADIQYWDKAGQFDYTSSFAYTSTHGNVTLTSWDKSGKTIAGIFSGVIYSTVGLGNWSNDSLIITNGKFNASYISQ
jgi:hypothetical protein